MKMKFVERLLQAFTGKDNNTIDIGRVIWFEAVQAYIGISIYALYKGGAFEAVTWGAGLAALLGAGGAALGLKAGVGPSEAMMIKTDKVTFKQASGRALPDDTDSDTSTPPDPVPDAPDAGDDTDTTSSASTSTVTKIPVAK